MKKLHFNIQGMTCASCQAHVTKAVEKLDGTKNVNVNLLANDMNVDIDESKVDVQKIIKAVENAGYGATLAEDNFELNDNKFNNETNRKNTIDNSLDNSNINNCDGTCSKSNINNCDDTCSNSNINNFDDTHSNLITNKSIAMKNRVQDSNDLAIKNMKSRLITSLVFWMPLMIIAMHKMLKIPMPIFDGTENALTFALVQLILTIPILVANRSMLKNGFRSLIKFAPNMDALVAVGATASFIYGCISIFKMSYGFEHRNLEFFSESMNNLYFDSTGTILTLITLGKFFEAKSKGKTGDVITKLINLAPKTSIVIRDGKEVTIHSEEIVLGDIIVIKPGTSIPVDGVVTEGSTSINQSSITGESIPVEKNVGDEVISGTINENGFIKMKATKIGNETTLAKIVKLVEDASTSKAPIENLADKIAYYFVPIVIGIALVTFVVWMLLGANVAQALNFAISVLVISCPCALGLATPVAIMVGTGKGAENGILFKNADALQTLGEVKAVVFDKTGTITKGRPIVTDIVTKMDEKEFLKIAYLLEKLSEHPLAKAVVEKVQNEIFEITNNEAKKNIGLGIGDEFEENQEYRIENKNLDNKLNNENLDKIDNNLSEVSVTNFKAVSGRGVIAEINNQKYFAGNIKLMEENNINTNAFEDESNKLLSQGKTVLFFANDKKLIGIIAVADTVKEDSKIAIYNLNKMRIKTAIITGDNKLVANEIAKQVGIKKVFAEVLPQDKERIIKDLQNNNMNKVAFVGDGINDSPALARANVGIAIGSGTDIAIESADVILVKNSLIDVANAIKLSKKTLTNIKENLFWAFFYNAICIPLAAGVFYNKFGLELNPMIGSLAMSFSSVFVVTNALRLRFVKLKNKEEKIMKEEIKIEGMMCENCVKHVTKALEGIDGVEKVEVSLENKNANIETSKEISDEVIKNSIEEAGYKVTEIKRE